MYEYKYVNKSTRKHPNNNGRPPNKTWITGSDPVRRDKYYAWQKHRAQAKYRREDYELTWEQWEDLWQDEYWFKRGRHTDCYCLMRLDFTDSWRIDNVEIVERSVYLKRSGEYRK